MSGRPPEYELIISIATHTTIANVMANIVITSTATISSLVHVFK